jgi:outer membrane protein TolC
LFNAELLVSSTLEQRYAALVQLYKALGGGWIRTSYCSLA